MKTTCAFCNSPIERHPSRINAYKNQFCNSACHDRFRERQVEVWCVICGNPLTMKASTAERTTSHSCSPECLSKLRTQQLIEKWGSADRRTVQCDYCGKSFERKPSQIAKYSKNYCSRECKNKGKHEPHPEQVTGRYYPCETCGKRVWRTPATVQPHTFCSRECTHLSQGPLQPKMFGPDNPAWNGGSSIFPYSWGFSLRERKAIKERDGYRCQECGKTREQGKLAVHHIDLGTTNHDLANLITLCVGCHRRAHQKKRSPAAT